MCLLTCLPLSIQFLQNCLSCCFHHNPFCRVSCLHSCHHHCVCVCGFLSLFLGIFFYPESLFLCWARLMCINAKEHLSSHQYFSSSLFVRIYLQGILCLRVLSWVVSRNLLVLFCKFSSSLFYSHGDDDDDSLMKIVQRLKGMKKKEVLCNQKWDEQRWEWWGWRREMMTCLSLFVPKNLCECVCLAFFLSVLFSSFCSYVASILSHKENKQERRRRTNSFWRTKIEPRQITDN
jgi:hypothetical protein